MPLRISAVGQPQGVSPYREMNSGNSVGTAKSGHHRTHLSKLADWVFGYDVFIWYTRLDDLERYAVGLRNTLTQKGLICFVDSSEFETGFSWQDQGRRALRKSSKIVLLLSPSVVASKGIKDELLFNISLESGKRPISVVNVGSTSDIISADSEFSQLLIRNGVDLSDQLWIAESPAAASAKVPSVEVVDLSQQRLQTSPTIHLAAPNYGGNGLHPCRINAYIHQRNRIRIPETCPSRTECGPQPVPSAGG